jgi:SpoIID/LytB domain protein
MVVGKELEIRRWFSWSHLFSSAFVVKVEGERFTFYGAGWGHGVGLCQIGAAVMASEGFSTEEILKHYFRGVEIRKIY